MKHPTLIMHIIPVGQKHTLTKKCKCQPNVVFGKAKFPTVNHRPGRGYRGLWRIKFAKGGLR
jgi:hypothetical protein